MFCTRLAWALLFGAVLIGQAHAQDEFQPQGAELKGFMAASTAVDAFIAALRNEDLDALIKVVEVPWYHDGKKILESKDAVRDFFRKPVAEEDFSQLKAKVEAVQLFKAVRDEATGATGEMLKQVAQDDDLLFRVTITLGSKSDGLMLLVRVNDKGAKIIGFRD